jgi:hypothetical protein
LRLRLGSGIGGGFWTVWRWAENLKSFVERESRPAGGRGGCAEGLNSVKDSEELIASSNVAIFLDLGAALAKHSGSRVHDLG